MYEQELDLRWDRGRDCFGGLNGVEQACNERSLELTVTEVTCMDEKQWRDSVNCVNSGINV